jgi:hypothetical protein
LADRRLLSLLFFAFGCNAAGTDTAPDDAGGDATVDATSETSPTDGAPLESAVDASGAPPCIDLDAGTLIASVDCVYGGHCPASCSDGTASAYLCSARADAAPTYPAELAPPGDSVDVLAFQPDAYPWDAGAYLSCAALTCTRWATGDHVNGASAWSSDPCAEGGAATQAWACPTLPGVLPGAAGCFNAGDIQRIGGPGTGVPVNVVWCCPSAGNDGGEETDGDAASSGAEP